MNSQTLKSNILLLLTACIWGFAFVAQRVGIAFVGPFTFNGVRFALGSLSLLPLVLFFGSKSAAATSQAGLPGRGSLRVVMPAGLIAGLILFGGASLQQAGLIYADTSAGKAAFITGLYIVLVSVLGVFLKKDISLSNWLGAFIALAGLYLLCIKQGFAMSFGDQLELIGAFFWAGHILVIDHFSQKVDALKLACTQFAVCATLSLAVALIWEPITAEGLRQASIPILYSGLLSVGVAYTLQIFGQKHAQPAPAAIIMSLETVFAAIGGAVLLHEVLGMRAILGCALMFAGMLLSQLPILLSPHSRGHAKPHPDSRTLASP